MACEHGAPYSILITGPVHVYASSTPPAAYPGTNFINELGPRDHPQVLEAVSGMGVALPKSASPTAAKAGLFWSAVQIK